MRINNIVQKLKNNEIINYLQIIYKWMHQRYAKLFM